MGTFKKIFYSLFLLVLIICVYWFYKQYTEGMEKKLITNALKSKDYKVILEKYEKLKLIDDKTTVKYLNRAFFKAVALNKTGKSKDAFPFFEHIKKHSLNSSHIYETMFCLGEYHFLNDEENKAIEYFNSEKLLDPTLKNYPLVQLYRSKISFNNSKFDEAIEILYDIIENEKKYDVTLTNEVKKFAGQVNLKRITTRKLTSNSVNYIIKPSDTLGSIATKFNTTVELIKKTNNYKSSVIHPHNHLKVINSTFSILISKKRNNLIVFEKGKFFKKYSVGTGKDNVTPIGVYKITRKQINPTWYKDGQVIPYGSPENCLGTRWMSINYPGYGIHGTNDESSIGSQSSAGCIRMKNRDVEELFSYITVNTAVEIRD